MTNEADRLSRAGNYVLGLMNEAERERAERDLERDASFRDAVLTVAERMRLVGAGAMQKGEPDERWRQISARLGELPQMRGVVPDIEASLAARPKPRARGFARFAELAASFRPSKRTGAIALLVLATFGIGYAAGYATTRLVAGPGHDIAGGVTQP
jgi:hypothetical protein